MFSRLIPFAFSEGIALIFSLCLLFLTGPAARAPRCFTLLFYLFPGQAYVAIGLQLLHVLTTTTHGKGEWKIQYTFIFGDSFK